MNLLEEICRDACPEYVLHLKERADDLSVGTQVLLYGQSSIAEMNETYQVQSRIPGMFLIGDDGGGAGFLMALDGSTAVARLGHGALGTHMPTAVAGSFSAWFDSGCPLPDDDDSDLPDYADLWLTARPEAARDLLAIKNVLKLDVSLGQLKQLSDAAPSVIARSVPFHKFARRANQDTRLARYLAFSAPGASRPTIRTY